MLLYIIRHGEPDYETDTLTERGIRQAEAVAKRLAQSGIDRVFSSPKGRAKETAAPLCRLLGLEMQIEDWTHEINCQFPLPDGTKSSLYRLGSSDFLEHDGVFLGDVPAQEHYWFKQTTVPQSTERIRLEGREFLERLGYREENGVYRILRPNEEKVALFCHIGFSRSWLSHLLQIPLQVMWSSFHYTHTGVTILEFKNHANGITSPRCLCHSDMSHLYAHGADMKYDNYIEI